VNEWARFWGAVLTALALTWLTHWVSGAVEFPLSWGWSALIGTGVAVLLWYWPYIWGLIDAIGDVLSGWW
jgi:hypothetical protein